MLFDRFWPPTIGWKTYGMVLALLGCRFILTSSIYLCIHSLTQSVSQYFLITSYMLDTVSDVFVELTFLSLKQTNNRFRNTLVILGIQDLLELNYDTEFQNNPNREVKLWWVLVFEDCLLTTYHPSYMETGNNLKTGHLYYA